MERFYHYFVSSLPLLRLFEEPSWTGEEFLAECARNLDRDDMALLNATLPVPEFDDEIPAGTMSFAWMNFEIQLRNRIALQVAGQRRSAGEYLRDSKQCYPEVERAVTEAWTHANPLEREKILDLYRWRFLSDQEATRPFGAFGVVCMYKIKLALVEKWNRRRREDGKENLSGILKESAHIGKSE